jgi:hypothetical protein
MDVLKVQLRYLQVTHLHTGDIYDLPKEGQIPLFSGIVAGQLQN